MANPIPTALVRCAPGSGPPRPCSKSTEKRIGENIKPQPNGCWIYNGQADRYGKTTTPGGTTLIHRFVYETLVGPIPDGHVLHHHCQTKGCCNPAHLEPLTQSDHMELHAELRRIA